MMAIDSLVNWYLSNINVHYDIWAQIISQSMRNLKDFLPAVDFLNASILDCFMIVDRK